MYRPGTSFNSHISAAVELRRQLHRRPELTWQEFATAEKLRTILTDLGIAWRACAGTGTVATLAPKAGGRHVALRADMDALPIQEAVDVPWKSELDGCMHACGHDGHTAALVATASWLHQHESQLPGPVTLLFQPAEEGGHGAQAMIRDGALEGYACVRPVEAVYGWHNWPVIPYGQAVCPDGVVMAANGTFEITVRGLGGHSSQPELCRDPLLAAAAIIMDLQQIVSRRITPQQSAVVSVTSCDGLSMPTVIRETVRLEGSIRIADTAIRTRVFEHITEISRATARSYGCGAEVVTHARYNATVNNAAEAALCRSYLSQSLGANWQHEETSVPIMASEDFSYYVEQIPGAFMLIGAGGSEEFSWACHNPSYQFNEDLIPVVVHLYSSLAGL